MRSLGFFFVLGEGLLNSHEGEGGSSFPLFCLKQVTDDWIVYLLGCPG